MRIGLTLVIDRIQKRSARFASKVLTAEELALWGTMKEHCHRIFTLFCRQAKFAKALETGIGRISFTDMSIANSHRAPYFAVALTAGVQLSISQLRTTMLRPPS